MILAVVIISLSASLQLVAAMGAFRMVRTTKVWPAWSFLAAGFILMAGRRVYSIFLLISGKLTADANFLTVEILALFISALLLTGIMLIKPLVSHFASQADAARSLSDRLTISEHKTRLLLERMPEALIVIANHRLAFASHAFGRIFGVKPEEATGRLLEEFIRPDHRYLVKEQSLEDAGVTATWGSRRVEVAVAHQGSESHWVEIRFLQFTEWEGQPAQICLAADITERTRTQQALRESEQRFRDFFDNANIGLYRISQSGRVILANPALVKLLGCSSFAEIEGKKLTAAGGEEGTRQQAFATAEAEAGEIHGLETIWRRADGTPIVVLENVRPIRDDRGRVRYFDGSVEDVSQRKKMQERVRQLERVESLGNLAGGVAHDFNNLLLAILASTELAQRRLSADEPSQRELDTIKRTAQRAAALTHRLLAFARRQTLDPLDINLNDMVREVLPVLQRVIPEAYTIHFSPALIVGTVSADKAQIEQVLLNLCANARDAMPDGGTIRVETKDVAISSDYVKTRPWAREGRYVLLSVSDQGEGIDPETLAHIFEPFFTTKATGRGTGLGLATVYGIVKQHGGMIDVISAPGKGATFHIYLPVVERPAQSIVIKTTAEPCGGSELILVVEDEPEVRQVLSEILTGLGYRVLTAIDGVDGLRVLSETAQSIDLVITDVVMPRMGGKELWAEVQKISPETLFLFSSGYAESVLDQELLKVPGVYFLSKPYSIDALASKLRDTLESRNNPSGRHRGSGSSSGHNPRVR